MTTVKKREDNLWLHKKPDTVQDWLGIVFVSVAFFVFVLNIGYFVGGLKTLLGYLSPFAGGIVIAYILSPIVKWTQKKFFHHDPKLRWVSILIAYALAALLLGALVWLVVPQVIDSVTQLFNNIPGYMAGVQAALDSFHDRFGIELQLADKLLEAFSGVMGRLDELVTAMAPAVMGYLGNAASNFVAVFTALASSVYMLADKHRLLHQLRTLVHAVFPPRVAQNILRICADANANFSGFFIGKIIDSLIIGLLTFVSMLILRLDFAPLISVLVGITNIIPVFGNFIGPKILGQPVGISALWVLFSIVLGGDMLGIVGMVLGVPVFATLFGLVKEFCDWCLMRRGIDAEGKPLPDVPDDIDQWTIRN